jgi:hypothetical protein
MVNRYETDDEDKKFANGGGLQILTVITFGLQMCKVCKVLTIVNYEKDKNSEKPLRSLLFNRIWLIDANWIAKNVRNVEPASPRLEPRGSEYQLANLPMCQLLIT